MTYTLTSPNDAVGKIARLFATSDTCYVSISEDRAFEDKFVALGTIKLFAGEATESLIARAISRGEYEWTVPSKSAFVAEIETILNFANLPKEQKASADDKLRRTVDTFGAIPARLGLSHPIFDPLALESMPFRRPTTVVSDTTGVLQGGLNFVARYLHPAARIKIPSVVQMEIVNFADRFLSVRRAAKIKPLDLLLDHTKSQSGQRVLLNLELHSDVELERTFLVGDPLRGAFKHDDDKELRELNLNVSIRTYADRLIMEAAKQHQAHVSPGHKVLLLTADQGLARMAMGEGMSPLYFKAAKAEALFGQRLTGVNFHPFSGAICTTNLVEILWELATAFGAAKLTDAESSSSLTVRAIGNELSWAPYHSHDDLLWTELDGALGEFAGPSQRDALTNLAFDVTADVDTGQKPLKPGRGRPRKNPNSAETKALAREISIPADRRTSPRAEPQIEGGKAPRNIPLHKYSVDKMLILVHQLDAAQSIDFDAVKDAIDIFTASGISDYRRFLESGDALKVQASLWIAGPNLRALSTALNNADQAQLQSALQRFPGYVGIERVISSASIGTAIDISPLGRAASTLLTWAELTGIATPIFGDGYFPTPVDPSDETFAVMACDVFNALDVGSGWVSTGRWLETLVTHHGIHPLVARKRLQAAAERGFLKRVTEGSTTETEFDRHYLKVLATQNTVPVIKIEHLYRGDFLIPGKASSSLKIEKSNG